MARGRKSRTWVKIDCDGILHGSINYLLPLEGQAIWLKMVAFSEVCGGKPGWIEDNNEKGLPYDYIAHELHCTVELLTTVIETMKIDGAVEINGTGSIHLVNFHYYQFSEYDRQKPYREKVQQKRKEEDFEKFVEEQRTNYPTLEVDKELVKFHLYWSEGSRRLQRPKTAFKNWLDKAIEIQQSKQVNNGADKRNNQKDGQPANNPTKTKRDYKGGKYGFMVK